MEGLVRAMRFITVSSWKYQYGCVVPFLARSCSEPGGRHQTRQRTVSGHSLPNPSKWWDSRRDKLPSDQLVQRFVDCRTPSEQGQMGKALDVLLHMDQQDTFSLVKAYKSLLHICMKKNDLAQAKQVYAHLAQHGTESTTFLGDYVVSTFVKCGRLDDALQVFNRMPRLSVSSWTSMISGYTMSGRGHEALEMYQRMKGEGVNPDKYTYISLLKACGNIADLEEGRRIHAEVVKHRQEADLFVRTCLVDMYGKCGSIVDAQDLFNEFVEWDVVAWNALLAAYAHLGQGEKALKLYEQMLEEGISPNVRTFVSMLQAWGVCAEQEDEVFVDVQCMNLQKAKVLHSIARRKGLDSNVFIANTLIALYGRCRSIVDAQNVFDGLLHRNVVSWNSILAAYAQQGLAMSALQLYEQMQHEGVVPNNRTYSTLIRVHGKCGNSEVARSIFDGLPNRNVTEWNAMLAAYASLGQGEKALEFYFQMQEQQVSPDGWTLVTALQACGICSDREADAVVDGKRIKVESLAKVKTVHADARKKSYDSDAFVSRTLVSVYGKCGSILDVLALFDGLSDRNVLSYNAILAACDEQLQSEKALQLYEQMLEEGISPDVRTLVSALQACSNLADKETDIPVNGQAIKIQSLHWGLAIHEHAQRKGYSSNVYVGSTLVGMYGRCGCILHAEFVFDRLSFRSVVSWNGMIAAYVQQEQAEKAFQLYEKVQKEGVSLDARTFVSSLQACRRLAEKEAGTFVSIIATKVMSLTVGKTLHVEARRRGFDSDVFVGNTLISLYGKCGSILDAQNVFYALLQRDVVSWNAMLTAYVEQRLAEKALMLYEHMREQGVNPNAQTFLSSLQACGILADDEGDVIVSGQSTKVRALKIGKAIHAEALMMGYDLDLFVGNNLVHLYGKCGSIADARIMFDRLSQLDVVAWTSMLTAYFEQGKAAEGLQLYEQMWEAGLYPDEISLLCILQACGSTGNLGILKEMHCTLVATRNTLSPVLASTLISAYGRCSSMVDAQAIFDALPLPDVVSWNSLITAYSRQGDCVGSLQCYEKMGLAGVKPDRVTFLSLVYACSHAGLVDKGVEYFESMCKDHGITPEIGHYVSMVDLLGRAGYFTIVELLLSTMATQPNMAFWLCLLGACQKHGKVVLGELAFHRALCLEPKHAAAYVLMANIYSDAGLLDRAIEVKKLRQTVGALKKPGESWIEHEQEVHYFFVGDLKHPQYQELYNLYENTGFKLSTNERIIS